MTLPCDEHAPGAVREALARVADSDPAFGDAMLVASELVTNAVRHSSCRPEDRLEVLVARREGHLVISVLDPGASGRTARSVDPEEEFDGLGLMVVQQLVSQWGEERGDGYRVWARLPLSSD
ncbi:MAG TPA: ATP-binding protein [Solirubrobacteraceae bacterium]|nr:ATP-binding protein [Solirubrobacteraceae bacterium]